MGREIGSVVVTGGAGAIGSRLVRRLVEDGAERVVVIDDLSSGYRWLVPDDSKVELVTRDVCDIAELGIDVESPLVFHLAAVFANQNSVDHPDADLHTNGLGTLNVLRWASSVRARRVVYASAGCSIAGHGIDAPIREDMPVSLDLDTPYQITKALGEFYCNYFLTSVSSVRCRFFNSFGPGETRSMQIQGLPGIPAQAKTVILKVTAANPTADGGYLTIWPTDAGATPPNVSNLNFNANVNIPNLVITKIGADGKINIFNAFGNTHVLVDVLGYAD